MQPMIKQPNFLRKKIKILNGDESPQRVTFRSGGVVHVRYYTCRIIANITIIIFIVIRCKLGSYQIMKICTIL